MVDGLRQPRSAGDAAVWRIVFAAVVSKALGAQGILFLGSSEAVREIIAHIRNAPIWVWRRWGIWTRKRARRKDLRRAVCWEE